MKENNLKEIGKRIKKQRKQQGLTQEKLAELMDVSIQMVSNLERGNKSIRIENLINLCKILNVSTDYILTGKNNGEDISLIPEKLSSLDMRERELISVIINYFTENT